MPLPACCWPKPCTAPGPCTKGTRTIANSTPLRGMDNGRMPPAASSPSSFVYLASQSPRRAQLLEQIGVAHRPLLPDAREDAEALEEERPGELPLEYVKRVTLLKLNAARARLKRRALPEAPILCADTTVALGRQILHKPA